MAKESNKQKKKPEITLKVANEKRRNQQIKTKNSTAHMHFN